jgi:hypothetical protein
VLPEFLRSALSARRVVRMLADKVVRDPRVARLLAHHLNGLSA